MEFVDFLVHAFGFEHLCSVSGLLVDFGLIISTKLPDIVEIPPSTTKCCVTLFETAEGTSSEKDHDSTQFSLADSPTRFSVLQRRLQYLFFSNTSTQPTSKRPLSESDISLYRFAQFLAWLLYWPLVLAANPSEAVAPCILSPISSALDLFSIFRHHKELERSLLYPFFFSQGLF